MTLFLYFIFFILGACTISFLKVLAFDYPQINVTRRSHCDHCSRILRWYEIIPIIGYFIVHGKCSQCKMQLDFYNPLQELLAGLFFGCIMYSGDYSYLPIFIMLTILAFTDHYYGYVYPIFYLLSLPTIILNLTQLHPLTSILIYLFLLLLSKRFELGLGDIEIMTILGLIFNITPFLYIVLLACFFCLITYLGTKKRSFRFIPYLAIATGVIYLIFSFRI